MAKQNKEQQGGGGIPAALTEALAGVPSAADAQPGDKSALGRLQSAFEAAREAVPGSETELAALLDGLIELCGEAILDEVDDAAATEACLFRAGEDLAHASSQGDPDALAVAVNALGTVLAALRQDSSTEEEGTGGADAEPEVLQIQGEEDEVIYTEFIAESSEHLENIEVRALELETSGTDIDLINDMFRCFHSMKGAAGFLGLTTINTLCHEVETMLDRARKLTLAVDRTVVDVLLASIDVAKQLLGRLHIQIEQTRGRMDESTPLPVVDTQPVLAAVRHVLERKPESVASADAEEADPSRVGGLLVAQGSVSEEQLRAALAQQKKPVGELLVEMGAARQEDVAGALARQSAAAQGKPKATAIKVDTQRLDNLMEMVGELVIAESLVQQDPALNKEENLSLMRNVGELDKIVRNLQELVMAMRLVPLKQTFQKMFRLVRDTARKTGKQVRLDLSGEDTEIDKTVIEEIADPLVHLLRNAVDHGIESPEERAAADKPEEGCVQLNAYHQGGNVVIEIADDGKGLDPDRLLAKGIEKGLIGKDASPAREEIFALIFAPGFSTHAVATDISGRGVGMDVVKRNIERLGGRVEIESELGVGTTFYVRLPLTMAIVDGMIVEVADERFVLPTLGIEESLRPSADQISTVANRGEMIMVRGDLLPLVRLESLFCHNGHAKSVEDSLVIIVGNEGRRCGLVVDELLGQQQVVIKNLGQRLKGIRGVSGGCILGDGRVGLILDVSGLLKLAETN